MVQHIYFIIKGEYTLLYFQFFSVNNTSYMIYKIATTLENKQYCTTTYNNVLQIFDRI